MNKGKPEPRNTLHEAWRIGYLAAIEAQNRYGITLYVSVEEQSKSTYRVELLDLKERWYTATYFSAKQILLDQPPLHKRMEQELRELARMRDYKPELLELYEYKEPSQVQLHKLGHSTPAQ